MHDISKLHLVAALALQFEESPESVESRVRAWNSKKRFSLAAGPSPDVDRKTSSLRRITAAASGKKGSGGEQSKSAPRPSCPTEAAAQQQELFQPHCQVRMTGGRSMYDHIFLARS